MRSLDKPSEATEHKSVGSGVTNGGISAVGKKIGHYFLSYLADATVCCSSLDARTKFTYRLSHGGCLGVVAGGTPAVDELTSQQGVLSMPNSETETGFEHPGHQN